ncbi:MAG: hypothetical protein H8E37_01795, partial [Planctomycetes bacterium]|nr:hypothetical protein [Planctomycetota bacterium]
KAGTYGQRVFYDLGWNVWSGIPDTTDNSMPKSETVAPIVETTIKLREPSPNDAQTVLDQVTKPRPETAWGQRSPPHGTWSALRYPVYLPLLRKIAGEHQDALATIAAIHTPAATDALIDLAEEGSSRARQLLPGRLPHPNFKTRANWNEAWTKREREVRQSWRDTNRERVMRIAWALLETDETEPTEERKKEWMLGGSLLSAIGKASDFDRFAAAANPIIESLGTVDSEQRQYPSPLTVSANFVVAGHQLLKAGAKADVTPKTAFESMMFMVAIQTNGEFRPVGWRRMTKRLMRHSMPRVRSTCVTSIPVPIDEEFVEPIIDLFDDNSPLVAATALTAVGAAKDSRFLKALLDVSKQAEDKWVRGAASHAASLCRPAPEPEPPAARSDSANEDVSAKARIDSLKIQVAAKEADLTRARLLFKKGLITRREVQRLEIELNSLIDVQKAEESFRKREKNKELAESATATQKANAEARRAALEAQITAKRAELERAKLLSKRGLITKLEVDKLEFELQTVLQTQKAEESIRKAEQELKAAEVAARKVTLKVKLTGESIAGVPLLFQLDVTNHTKSPFEYWCGGPGLYPNASMFVAEITDSTGKSRKVVLHNGQNFEGSGFNRQVEKEASLPAACAPLSPGKYTVTVSCGPTAVLAGAHFEQWPEMKSEPITIEIRDEPQSIERFDDALRDQSAKSPFAKHVARVYGIAPIVNEWLQQLLDDDPSEAFKIVGYLSRCRRLPKGGDGIVLQAAKKHTTSERPEKNLLRYISMIGRNIGSDTSLEAVNTIAMADVDNYARSGAVNDLGELSQPKAEKLLVRLAEDPASPVYWSAIRALAQKKNRLALDVLLETLEAGDEKQRVHIINLLKNFADDQDAQEAVKRALDEAPKGDSQESREKKSDSDADDSAAKVPAPKAEAAETALSMAKWSKVLKGLRIRTAAPQTTYEAGDRLPVLAELQNAGDEPIPFSKLYTVRVRILDKNNKWVGYARAGLDITPWEGRTGNFAPGDSLKWTIWLEQSRFNKSVPAGSMVSVDVSVPTQKLVPGKLPTTEYSEPVRIRFDSIPISTLSASDFGNSWSEKNTIIYREVGGLFAPSRSLQIDGSGLCAAVRPESRNPPENPLLPPGRFTVKLSAERLNRIAALLADTDFQALSKAKRLAYPDEPTVLMSISVDGKNFLGEFPDGVIRKTPAVAALQTEMRSVMAIVKKSEAEKTANFDELTKQRREKLLAEADSFQLHLGYYEDPDKPYFALQLQTRPVEANNFFRRSHQLNRKQIETLIGGLEQGSFLRNGKAGPAPNPTYKEGYILYLWCKGHTQYEVLGFPDNKEMLKRL